MSEDVFARTYGVELLCAGEPGLPRDELLTAMQQHCPGAQFLGDEVTAFVHPATTADLGGQKLPAQTLIATSDRPVRGDELAPALGQTWDFSGAAEAVARSTHSVLVTDLMSSGVEYRARLDLFLRALRAVLEVVPCEAIHWRPSSRIVDPTAFLAAYATGDPAQLMFASALNVRLFRVEGSDRKGELVMDTLGLGALGLPDVQCHFVDLEAPAMARFLSNLGWYLYSNGDVIETGHTVEGMTSGDRWRCQHESSLVGPDRVVLDVNPGPPHAAGR